MRFTFSGSRAPRTSWRGWLHCRTVAPKCSCVLRESTEPRSGKPRTSAKPNREVHLLGRRPIPADHSDLELIVRHVAEERRIVARQRELIARLRAAGASTSGAEETLKAFEANLAIFEERERDLRQKGGGANAVMFLRGDWRSVRPGARPGDRAPEKLAGKPLNGLRPAPGANRRSLRRPPTACCSV